MGTFRLRARENKMKLSTSVLIGVVAAWTESDYPDHQFKCVDNDGEVFCKWIKCKLFPKLKVTNKAVPGLPTDVIQCPSLAESGCPTQWGMRYQVGKSNSKLYEQDTHDLVPPNGIKHSSKTGKLTVTCLNSGANSKAFCRPKYTKNATPANIEFTWQSGSPPSCAGPGESWAQWGSWSGVNTSTCERGTASRSRQCLDGEHPGTPTSCSTQPAGPENEEKTYWPKVCKKCHADLGMMHTPGTLNVPNLKLPSTLKDHEEDKFDDGFVPVGEGVVKLKCHDQEDYVKPYKQKCKCDNDGCRLSDAPLCQGVDYKGYGTDYFWQPGAKDTFKNEDTNEFSTVTVNDDFSITYENQSHDPDQRFPNRVAWWPNGPSICRYWNKYSYVAGVERPIFLNDDGSLDFVYYNWLECDNYVQNFPAANPHGAGISNGAKYYEVLTADNNAVDWKPAGSFTDEEIEDRMVIVGNSEQFERKFYGLCRLSSCTVTTQLGGECHNKTPNFMSKHMVEHMEDGYPGILYWRGNLDNGNWKCQNLLVTASIAESEDPSKFEILFKN